MTITSTIRLSQNGNDNDEKHFIYLIFLNSFGINFSLSSACFSIMTTPSHRSSSCHCKFKFPILTIFIYTLFDADVNKKKLLQVVKILMQEGPPISTTTTNNNKRQGMNRRCAIMTDKFCCTRICTMHTYIHMIHTYSPFQLNTRLLL